MKQILERNRNNPEKEDAVQAALAQIVPYMCKGSKSITSILQNLWDAGLKDRNVMIILCGSAMNFIEKELLAENIKRKFMIRMLQTV